jgi:hypothetical protein
MLEAGACHDGKSNCPEYNCHTHSMQGTKVDTDVTSSIHQLPETLQARAVNRIMHNDILAVHVYPPVKSSNSSVITGHYQKCLWLLEQANRTDKSSLANCSV